MDHLPKVSSIQYLLEPPQVCILRHRWLPPWVHRFPMWHHHGPTQGPSHHINFPTTEFTPTAELTRQNFLGCFVPDYTTRAHDFLRLLHHDIPFQWDEHSQSAFD
jgi:hypothetical protein